MNRRQLKALMITVGCMWIVGFLIGSVWPYTSLWGILALLAVLLLLGYVVGVVTWKFWAKGL